MRIPALVRAALFAVALGSIMASPAGAQNVGALFSPVDRATINAATKHALNGSLDDVIKDAEHLHPVAMIFLAKRLFDADRRDEAVFWFYEGQLRWRAHLAYNKDQMEADMFSRLHASLAPEINHHGLKDVPAMVQRIDKVLAWDASHPDNFTPAGKHKDDARKGLEYFKTYIVEHQDEIKRQQEEDDKRTGGTPDDPWSGSGGALFGTPQEMVRNYDTKMFDALRIGVSTKNDVVKVLGKPEWWSTNKDGVTTFGYTYRKTTSSLAMMGLVEAVSVIFTFNKDKLLTEIKLPKEKTVQ